MLVEIEEIRKIRNAIAPWQKPEWRVAYKQYGDKFVQWIHADDEVGVYAELLHRLSGNSVDQNTGTSQ